MANTFTSLIKCSCGYNYRFIKERGVKKYLCSGYAKKQEGGCTERNILREDILLDIIQIYCNRHNLEMEDNNKFMKSIIYKIDIDSEHNILIHYNNGEKGIIQGKKVHI